MNQIIRLSSLTYFLFVFHFNFYAQIKQPESPSYKTNQSVNNVGGYTNSTIAVSNRDTNLGYTPKPGATADDIKRQTYNLVSGPVYLPGMTPQEIQQANMAFVRNQMMSDPNYNPALRSNKQQIELTAILNEVNAEQQNISVSENYQSSEFLTKTKSYETALRNLKDMLAGKQKLSVSRAYFEIENAHGDSYLNKKEFENIIKESADFIKKWLAQNGYDPKNNEALHLGIQKFMGDTLTITSTSPDKTGTLKTTHIPFSYDYEDFKGEKDFRNYFLTKNLATGSGQCNSLPAVYLSLAEALGAVRTYPLHRITVL